MVDAANKDLLLQLTNIRALVGIITRYRNGGGGTGSWRFGALGGGGLLLLGGLGLYGSHGVLHGGRRHCRGFFENLLVRVVGNSVSERCECAQPFRSGWRKG